MKSYPELMAEGLKRTLFKEQMLSEARARFKFNVEVQYEEDTDGWKSHFRGDIIKGIQQFEKFCADVNRRGRVVNVYLTDDNNTTLLNAISQGGGSGEGIEFGIGDCRSDKTFKDFKSSLVFVVKNLPVIMEKANKELQKADDPDDEEEIMAIDAKYARQMGLDEIVEVADEFEDDFEMPTLADAIREFVSDEWYG